MSDDLLLERDGDVAQVILDRPDKRNAFDDALASRLADAFEALGAEPDLRAIVLAGRGKTFCAGGDLAWMRRVASYTHEENLGDAAAFQRAYEAIDRCPVPVVARIQGAALGGGAGLVAACDIAVAAADAVFGFPEVRLGLVPGVISPYVVRAIGARHARHLFLTGERFDVATALRLGLVHRVAAPERLDDVVGEVLATLRKGAPGGVRAAKRLVMDLVGADEATQRAVARQAIADARASADGQEGTTAFLEGRPARWLREDA